MVAGAENPFDGAKSIGKILSDFMDLAEREGGDEHILEALDKLNREIFAVLSDDYGKHARSILLQTINKITAPEKSSRHRHNWLMPYLEEVQSCMRTMVNEAKVTFGAGFPQQIVPSFEHGVRELNSLLQNQDILSIRADGGKDIRMRKSVQENTEDKISAISVTGYLINMIEDMNEYIREMAAEFPSLAEAPPQISNSHLLETLNLRTVGRKIESIANTIICPMEEEMKKLLDKHLEELGTDPAGGAKDELSLSLPQFAVSPHNYVTGIGHGLLSQMNTIGAYGADRNFIRAIRGAADDTKSPFNDQACLGQFLRGVAVAGCLRRDNALSKADFAPTKF